MDLGDRIFVAGHRGLLGRALVKRLRASGYRRLLLATHAELDLRRPSDVLDWFRRERPDHVFLAAALVGGIVANQKRPAELVSRNLEIETAVIAAAHATDVQGLCLFGSSCMYPRDARQPMAEDLIGTGPVEPTSRAYAAAKLAGLELCRAYRSQYGRRFYTLVPATLYGPHDHFGTERAHVIPALLERFHRAARDGSAAVTVLGSGRPRREFLFVDDAADAALLCMESAADLDVLNAGSGEEVTIDALARQIADVVGYTGQIRFDRDAPDGAPRKLLDSRRLRALGWIPKVALPEGLERAYAGYVEAHGEGARPCRAS